LKHTFNSDELPQWLYDLIGDVIDCIECSMCSPPDDLLSMCIYEDESIAEGFMVVEMAPSVGEIYGGKDDGKTISSSPRIRLGELSKMFDFEMEDGEGESFVYAPGDDREGDRIEMWGENVLMKIFLAPFPDDEPRWRFSCLNHK